MDTSLSDLEGFRQQKGWFHALLSLLAKTLETEAKPSSLACTRKDSEPARGAMEITQNIHIQQDEKGSFVVVHKHKDFQQDTFLVKSKTGLVPLVRNLINGRLPALRDLYLPEGGQPTESMEKARPLD
jgi:hypothetical protein